MMNDKITKSMSGKLPPAPGTGGNGAVFTCPVCGQKFVRTMPGQSKCSACYDKEKIVKESVDNGKE